VRRGQGNQDWQGIREGLLECPCTRRVLGFYDAPRFDSTMPRTTPWTALKRMHSPWMSWRRIWPAWIHPWRSRCLRHTPSKQPQERSGVIHFPSTWKATLVMLPSVMQPCSFHINTSCASPMRRRARACVYTCLSVVFHLLPCVLCMSSQTRQTRPPPCNPSSRSCTTAVSAASTAISPVEEINARIWC